MDAADLFPEAIKTAADAERHYRDLATFKAAEDSRKLTLPQKPEDYAFELPADFKVPQGIEYKLNPDDPMAAQARAFALEAGLSKDQFGKLLSMHAAGEVARVQAFNTAVANEIATLGASGTARVTAVQNYLAAQLGEPLARHMATMLVTAKHVEGFEKLMENARTQGAGSFSGGNREPPQAPGRVDEETFRKMSPAARLDYARQFPQSQFNGGGR